MEEDEGDGDGASDEEETANAAERVATTLGYAPGPANLTDDSGLCDDLLLLGSVNMETFTKETGKFPYPRPVSTDEEVSRILGFWVDRAGSQHKTVNLLDLCKVNSFGISSVLYRECVLCCAGLYRAF